MRGIVAHGQAGLGHRMLERSNRSFSHGVEVELRGLREEGAGGREPSRECTARPAQAQLLCSKFVVECLEIGV